METWNEQQQRLGAVINNNLGITLKQQAEWLLAEIKKLEWYKNETEELVDPKLIGYYFSEEGLYDFYGDYDEALIFCVMKSNMQDVDYKLIATAPEIDEARQVSHIYEYYAFLELDSMPWRCNNEDAVSDIAVPIRSKKVAKLLEVF